MKILVPTSGSSQLIQMAKLDKMHTSLPFIFFFLLFIVNPGNEGVDGYLGPKHMAWKCSGKTNAELLGNLKRHGIIASPEVFDAMSKVDRAHYIPTNPYADSAQFIEYNSQISSPHIHAAALEYLKDNLKPYKNVLDIGSGTGYLTVCIAHMVKATEGQGTVVGIDHISEIVALSVENVRKDIPSLLKSPNFRLATGDGWKGFPELAPFDAINVGAAASEVPQVLLDQLAPLGKMLIPIGPLGNQRLYLFTKEENGTIHKEDLSRVNFIQLVRLGGKP